MKILRSKWIKFALSATIIAVLIFKTKIDFSRTLQLLYKPEYLLMAVCIPLIIIPSISNNRWKVFLFAQGIRESFWTLVRINFISIFLGILLPSSTGFDAIRIYIIEKRHKHKIGSGGAAILTERLLGFYILSILGVIGALVSIKHQVPLSVLYAAIGINIALTMLIVLIRNNYLFVKVTRVLSEFKRGASITNYLTALIQSINNFPIKQVLPVTVPLILLYQLSTIVCSYLIFSAFGVNLPFYYHLVFMPLIQIITILPISISGLGLREGGFVFFYGIMGIKSEISFLVSLIYYAVLMLVPAFIGMILYLFGKESYKSVKQAIAQ